MKTLPYAKPIGIYEAKTHFSKIVDDIDAANDEVLALFTASQP